MTDNPAFAAEVLENILQHTEEGILLVKALRDENNTIVDFEYLLANRAAQRIVGKSEQELVGKRMLEVLPGNKTSGLFDQYVQVVETGQRYSNETFYAFDNLKQWFRINVSKLEDGALINFTDITALKNAVFESARSRQLYSILVRHLPGVDVALIDRGYQVIILKGNPFKSLIADQPIENGMDLSQLPGSEEKANLMSLLKASFRGKPQRREVEVGEKMFRLTLVPVQETHNRYSHVLVLSEDMSIFRFSQDELRNKIYALESANESLEQFAYVASHDLQEPLRKIQAFGSRLSLKYADQLEETGQDYIARMQNAAARMQTLINDLLKYSRAGRMREPFQPVDLESLIAAIRSDLETTIQQTKAQIITRELPTVQGEPSQLRQLFQNLISNALKFRQPDVPPEIVISCQAAAWADKEVPGNLREEEDYYKIMVADNGIGFDEKYLDRIFNIFQRLHGRSEYEGTGIGLAICRKIAENHEGAISAASQPGKGATFYVLLPQNLINHG